MKIYYKDFDLVGLWSIRQKEWFHVNNVSLKPGTICPYESIDWVENGVEFSFDCFDEDGTSKGLKVIAAELGFQFDPNKKYLLKEYREAVSSHIAFQNKTSNNIHS